MRKGRVVARPCDFADPCMHCRLKEGTAFNLRGLCAEDSLGKYDTKFAAAGFRNGWPYFRLSRGLY